MQHDMKTELGKARDTLRAWFNLTPCEKIDTAEQIKRLRDMALLCEENLHWIERNRDVWEKPDGK